MAYRRGKSNRNQNGIGFLNGFVRPSLKNGVESRFQRLEPSKVKVMLDKVTLQDPANEITLAQIELVDGKPYSPIFQDIYATRSGAYGQACAVFLAQGEIASRWANKKAFCILENGFGLGTNFLATLKAWREDPNRPECLDYVSIERFPASAAEIERYAAPEVRDYAKELAASWPQPLPGFHVLEFDHGRVRLTLIFHDARKIASELSLNYDALFLDGFSPSKNPQMWEPHLLMSLARYAKPQATVTTWCTAGAVRATLTRAGFLLEKRAGFGAKSERLFGVMRASRSHDQREAYKGDVIVIGAGLAGSNVAFELSRRGVPVRVIDEGAVPGFGASALAWGILHPHFSRDDNLLSRLSREGFLATCRRLDELERSGVELSVRDGCLQMAHTDEIYAQWQEAVSKSLPFKLPESYARFLTASQASEEAGIGLKRGGWFFPHAGMVRVGAFCRALISASQVPYRGNTRVERLVRRADKWALYGQFGELLDEANHIVLANAWEAQRLLQTHYLAFDCLPGRITLLRDTDLVGLKIPVSGEGYMTRMPDGFCGVGATYELPRTGLWTENRAHEENLAKLERLLLNQPQVVVTGAYCGQRASGLGRLPYVGPVCDELAWFSRWKKNPSQYDEDSSLNFEGLWLHSAFGSRGVSMTTRTSQILGALITGSPVPAEKSLLKGIGSARAVIRWLKSKENAT